MPGLVWKEEIIVGIPELDEQYRKWFIRLYSFYEQINHVENMNYFLNRKYFKQFILFTIEYLTEHFDREEKMMIECGYPDYYREKESHDRMRLMWEEYLENNDAEKLIASVKFLKILKERITSHIHDDDRQFACYIRKMSEE
jgi:hemerythrin-like metal-binding protein